MNVDDGFLHRVEIGAREAATLGVRSRWVMADGLRTHYVETGEGLPIVLVHGGGPGVAGFVLFPHLLPALGQHFRTIAIDLRGFGLTDVPTGEPFTFKRQARHLTAFIDALCLPRVGIVGNSMGVGTAVHFVVDHPDRVDKVLAIGSGSLAAMMGIQAQPPPSLNLAEMTWNREAIAGWLAMVNHRQDLVTDDVIARRVELANLPGAAAWLQEAAQSGLAAMEDPDERFVNDMRGRLPAAPVTIRLAWGRDDSLATPTLLDELRRLLPGMDSVSFDGAGHELQNDVPEEFNAMAREYFGDREEVDVGSRIQ